MKNLNKLQQEVVDAILLVLILALVYLPYVQKLTYYLDDWYYIYNGFIAGPKIFYPMFNIDRPARGYFFDLYFSLFGPQPLPYHLGMYFWRTVAGLSALRLLNILWPFNRKFNFLTTLFFVLYPGFSWWVSGVEYQPMMASLALQTLSFVFTLKGLSTGLFFRSLYIALAVVTGWLSMSLAEYTIGLEGLRFLIIYLYINNGLGDFSFINLRHNFSKWIWYLVIPAGFLVWRIFLFDNHRVTTDMSVYFTNMLDMPSETLQKWAESFLTSFVNVNSSWISQFIYQYHNSRINLPQVAWAIAISIVLIVVLFIFIVDKESIPDFLRNPLNIKYTGRDSFFLGLGGLLLGLFPIIFANRHVNLTIFSHYGLPVSLAAAMMLSGLIQYLLRVRYVQYIAVAVIVWFSLISTLLIAEKTIFLEDMVENFWWQVYWRIPDLDPDTTLITQYPDMRVVDNELGLADPVNLIYFPELQTGHSIRYPVSTLIPVQENIDNILAEKPKKKDGYRVYELVLNFQNVLILSQPTSSACVHVIDGSSYILSSDEPENISIIASKSKINNIRINDYANFNPPAFAFGREPFRGWCFYYQKAGLALQQDDFVEITRLAEEIKEKRLYPIDKSEWFPFFVAFTKLQDISGLDVVMQDVRSDIQLLLKFCAMFEQSPINREIQEWIITPYCKSK